MYDATGYRDTAGDVRRKFEHDDDADAEGDEDTVAAARGGKMKGSADEILSMMTVKGKMSSRRKDGKDDKDDDELPTIVVLDEKKHLSRELVEAMRRRDDDDDVNKEMMVVDAHASGAEALASRPMFKKRSSTSATTGQTNLKRKLGVPSSVSAASATATNVKRVKNKKLLSFGDDEDEE
jgi:hypothetical protein